MKKIFIILLILISLANFVFATNYCNNDMICNNLETKYNCPSDCANFRLGIGEPLVWMNGSYNWSIENSVQKLSDFNSEIHRVWFDKHSCLSSYNTIDPTKCAKYKQATQLLTNKGIILVGLDGTTGPYLTGVNEWISVPRRDLSPNSNYLTFLNKYQASWKAFSEYFPEVKYWEVGNEPNINTFLHSFNDSEIPFDEKVQIVVDMMYYAKKGINEGNPGAFVFMHGLASGHQINEFLDKIYSEIATNYWGTTNPRDFFDGLTWHPYGAPNPTWKQDQINIYAIAKQHGDDGIPVFFSEYGYSDNYHGNQSQNATNATLALNYFANDMPWLWGLTWFRLYDEPLSTWGGASERAYGLITSPNNGEQAKPILNSYLQFANNLNYNKYSFTFVPQLDGKEIGKFVLFRNDGYWFISCENNYIQTKYGTQDDVPVMGDFDGDNKQDLAVFRPFTQEWYIKQSSTGEQIKQKYGMVGDLPTPGDYDGDGITNIAVFRPSTQDWFVRGTNGGTTKQQYGMINDMPFPADYNGDGVTDFAVFRPATQEWYLRINNATTKYKYGMINDIPVPADYDGDGKTDVAIYRPYDQTWHIRNSSTDQTTVKKFGTTQDIPAPGDYDGDGIIDIGVYRPSTLEIIFNKPTNNKIKIEITTQTKVTSCTTTQTPTPICTIGDWSSSDGDCQSNNKLTRTWTQSNTNCINGIQKPATEQVDCPYIPPQKPICQQFTERYSQSQLNTHITNWKSGNLSLTEIIKRAKINKYCD